MARVQDNLEEIRNMFPDIELNGFLVTRLEQRADLIVDYILEHQNDFARKRKRTHDETLEEDHEKTLTVEQPGEAEVFPESLDLENREIVSFFDALVNHFKRTLENETLPPFSSEQISQLTSFFASKFKYVRFPSCRWLVTPSNCQKCMLDPILVVLFFIENHAIETESFNHCLEGLVSARSRRISNGMAPINTIRSKLEPLYKPRGFNADSKINDPTLAKLVNEAINKFEKVLLRLLNTSSNKKAFAPMIWMGKSILDYFANEETFECTVCFDQFPVFKAFYCTSTEFAKGERFGEKEEDEHPFCLACVRGQAEASINEALLSEGALGLRCMATDCKNPILFSNIRLYLPHTLRSRLDKRITNQALTSAGLSNLEFCSRCDFAMVLEDDKEVNKVFECQKCNYSYCRLCEEDWSKHFGLSCAELKSQSEDAKRRELEKKLNEAVVRCCPKCHLQFVKLEACNKMTCRCGTTQCYICRATDITYEHFCNHARDPRFPNMKCEQCKEQRCLLWEDFKKRDREMIEQLVRGADIKVDIPKSPQPGTSHAGQLPQQFQPPARLADPRIRAQAQGARMPEARVVVPNFPRVLPNIQRVVVRPAQAPPAAAAQNNLAR